MSTPATSGLCAHLLLDGYWEMGLTMHMARTVRAGMTAIDVGANFGYYTILLGALVGEGGHVFAVEPAPATAAMLRRSVELNGFQNSQPSSRPPPAPARPRTLLHVPPREPKNAQLVASPTVVDNIPGTLHRVAQASIDALAADQRRIDYCPRGLKAARLIVIGAGKARSSSRRTRQARRRRDGQACRRAAARRGLCRTAGRGHEARQAADLALGVRLRAYAFDRYKTKRKEVRRSRPKSAASRSRSPTCRARARPRRARAGGRRRRADRARSRQRAGQRARSGRVRAPRQALKKLGVAVEVLDVKAMQKLGMNALLGVGQGSAREAASW